MTANYLTAKEVLDMFLGGAANLARHAEQVDRLNVFPVPDGDTGTNMNLTMSSGVSELKRQAPGHAGKAAQAFSKGLMMGARGNSGVILSQLFRGFSKSIMESDRISGTQLAKAFTDGVSMAYEAVMKPVEGTILTVAREAAAGAVQSARNADNALQVMADTLEAARKALARTPEMLPVLKEVGVVDSGGQGLVYIYEGFVQALQGEVGQTWEEPALSQAEIGFQSARVQAHLKTEDIEHGYCTEFMINLLGNQPFHQASFREEISRFGDSLLVVADEELVKIHIHSEQPGEVLSFGQKYGELTAIKIENMREQHHRILEEDEALMELPQRAEQARQPYGIVAVSMGEGISNIFKSLGADQVVAGGQSMNPSTEDLVKAAGKIRADHVIFLPNNKNVIMAAEQAAQLLDVPATVIPSRSVPQGMGAMLKLDRNAASEKNRQAMTAALANVKTGQVTYAVRDTKMDGMDIKEGDMLGLLEGEIVEAGSSVREVAHNLVSRMVGEEDEVLTIIYGEDVAAEQAEELLNLLQDQYPDLELELHEGGQPLYSYIFSAE